MARAAQPGTVRVAVTGHRTLAEPARVAADVDDALEIVARFFPAPGMTILSALAEGADRLVAERALARSDASLVAVLPMSEDEYLHEFSSPESREAFRRLVDRATEVVLLPPTGSREAAYARLGAWLVEHCDVLVAIWDGNPARGPGGTADVVDLARSRGRHTIRIRPGGGEAL